MHTAAPEVSVSPNGIGQTAPRMPAHEMVLRVALQALSVSAARYVTLVVMCALFVYAALEPAWMRLATVSTFAALGHLPLWFFRSER